MFQIRNLCFIATCFQSVNLGLMLHVPSRGIYALTQHVSNRVIYALMQHFSIR